MTYAKHTSHGPSLGLTGAAMGQVIGKAEDQIRWRQSAYQTMAWNMGRIKANIEGTYNKDQVVQAANVIQAIATSGMGALFQSNTNTGKGWHETNVKPEFFKPESKDELGKHRLRVRGRPEDLPVSAAFLHRFRGM